MIGANLMYNQTENIKKNQVAVSSLESPLHAVRKDPKIITTTWFIGKRCNYDCSYCSSFTHDNYSPHIKKENAFNFLDQLEKYAIEQKKNFKLQILKPEQRAKSGYRDLRSRPQKGLHISHCPKSNPNFRDIT